MLLATPQVMHLSMEIDFTRALQSYSSFVEASTNNEQIWQSTGSEPSLDLGGIPDPLLVIYY